MDIAKIIHSGIPKVGEAYMSDNISYYYSLPTAQKFQVIGYGDYCGDLTMHVFNVLTVTDVRDFKVYTTHIKFLFI